MVIILLLLACSMPMFFAFGKGPDSQSNFKAAIAVAIMVPVLAYAMWMVYRILNKNKKVVDSDMENIIFDVGQVLVKYDWETYLDSFGFPKEERDTIAKAVFLSDVWNERDRSSQDEQYYVDEMVKAAPQYEKDIREVMRRSNETVEKMDYAETWVKYLKDQGLSCLYSFQLCDRYPEPHTGAASIPETCGRGSLFLSGKTDQTGTGYLPDTDQPLSSESGEICIPG